MNSYILVAVFLLCSEVFSQSLPKPGSQAEKVIENIKQKAKEFPTAKPAVKSPDPQGEYEQLLSDKLKAIQPRPLQPETVDVDPKKPKANKEVPKSINQKNAKPKAEEKFFDKALNDYREQIGDKSFKLDDEESVGSQKRAQTEYERITKELEKLNKIDQAQQDEQKRIETQQAIQDARENLKRLDKYKKYKNQYEKKYNKELNSKKNEKLGVLNDDEFLESGGLEDYSNIVDPFEDLQDDTEDENSELDE